MNWAKAALVAMFVLSAIIWVVPWVTGIGIADWPPALVWTIVGGLLLAMIVFGWGERRKEREADTWVDDPRKSKLQNWMVKRRQRFSMKRGVEFFFYGLIAFSIMIGFKAIFGEVASVSGAIAFVLGVSVVAGLIGMFTEKVPL